MSHGVEWVGVEWGGVARVEDDDQAMLPTEDAEADACDMADPDLAESIALNVHTLVGWWVCVRMGGWVGGRVAVGVGCFMPTKRSDRRLGGSQPGNRVPSSEFRVRAA